MRRAQKHKAQSDFLPTWGKWLIAVVLISIAGLFISTRIPAISQAVKSQIPTRDPEARSNYSEASLALIRKMDRPKKEFTRRAMRAAEAHGGGLSGDKIARDVALAELSFGTGDAQEARKEALALIRSIRDLPKTPRDDEAAHLQLIEAALHLKEMARCADWNTWNNFPDAGTLKEFLVAGQGFTKCSARFELLLRSQP